MLGLPVLSDLVKALQEIIVLRGWEDASNHPRGGCVLVLGLHTEKQDVLAKELVLSPCVPDTVLAIDPLRPSAVHCPYSRQSALGPA